MAEFVVPRHSAVMERLRRRIELFRRHHNSCENRYDSTAMERLEQERQQTFALHQRCLQTKAKRSKQHRQPQTGSEPPAHRGSGAGGAEPSESGGGGGGAAPGEQSRNSTLIALQETVKRKLESAGSPVGREQVNGYSDGYPPSKKSCLEDALSSLNGTSNGAVPPPSPIDTKHGVVIDSLALNGVSTAGANDHSDVVLNMESDIRLKELKQEPMDDILPPGGGNGNIILPDLNLNEQEWTELMEEFNRSVPYDEIQALFSEGFEDRKDTDLASGAVAPANLLSDLAGTVKAEYSPVPAFDQDSRTGSPHVPPTSSGPNMHASSPIMPASSSSPALSGHQHAPQQPGQARQHQNHSISPAQQLQQLAARVQTHQHQAQKQQQQQQQTTKFHQQPTHTSTWQSAPTQSPLGGSTYGLEKPTSPSLYPSEFQNPKSLLMSGQQPNKGSPKAGTPSGYMQPSGHPMLGHATTPSGTLNHPPAAGGQASMLDYNNTKPLSHFETVASRAPATAQNQNNAALLNLLRQHQQQQQQQHIKNRANGVAFRPSTHLPHAQEPGSYPSAPHVQGPGGAMVTAAGGGGMAANHGNAAYLSNLQKQQQQQQMQKHLLQRQLMAEQQEKQRQQQEQQLQRHLTRPPPQYQDQPNPAAQQNPFQQQQQVSQFAGSSQTMGGVNSLVGPAPGAQRMFSQTQPMMAMGQGGGPVPGAPPAASQAELSLSSCSGGLDAQQVLYANMPMQRVSVSTMQNYRHNVLAQQQAHLKQQQQLARMPNSMSGAMAANMGTMSNSMPSSMAGNIQGGMPPQPQSWQQHPGLQQGMTAQQNPNNNALPTGFPNSGFHMQPRMPKMPGSAQFTQAVHAGAAGRAMVGMNPSQMQIPNMAQQRTPTGSMAAQQSQQPPQAPPPVQQVLPDLGPFGQPQGGQVPNRTAGMPCNQAYQVNRTASQQMAFSYGGQSGGSLPSFPGESDLVDSLLKNQSTEEWMDDLNELLASHQ